MPVLDQMPANRRQGAGDCECGGTEIDSVCLVGFSQALTPPNRFRDVSFRNLMGWIEAQPTGFFCSGFADLWGQRLAASTV